LTGIRITGGIIVSLLCAVGFGAIALLIGDQRIEGFDNAVISFVRGLESDVWTNVFVFFTWMGSGLCAGIISLAAMVFLYAVLGHRKELILLASVGAGSWILNETLKAIFERARPTVNRIVEAVGYSFPSGHSMGAFSLYGILAFLLWKHIRSVSGRILLLVVSGFFVLMIGVSRIYVGVHYPSDIVGGYLASGCWVFAAIWVYQKTVASKQAAGESRK
jgi:undecaprenyl-diphosphatase